MYLQGSSERFQRFVGESPFPRLLPVASRVHNQYQAERTFGVEFMRRKRDEARRRGAIRRRAREAQAAAEAQRQAAVRARAAVDEVIKPLRVLGFNADEARRAAALCESIPEASLEQRVRRALSYFHPPSRTVAPAATGPAGVT